MNKQGLSCVTNTSVKILEEGEGNYFSHLKRLFKQRLCPTFYFLKSLMCEAFLNDLLKYFVSFSSEYSSESVCVSVFPCFFSQ